MSNFPPLFRRDLPDAPSWTRAVGVGVVIVGMAMGTGELIMWPHLVTKHGLGILWLAIVGITLQYFINQEVIRHTLATGESFFTTSARVIFWTPIFWFWSALLLYIWPGWASTLGTILAELAGYGNHVTWALVSLGLVLLLTFSGHRAYEMLEKMMRIIVPIFFFLLVGISIQNLSWTDIAAGAQGLVNFGYIPKGIDLEVLLGAVVFAGAGGMLNLCTSLWYRDKQAGMARYEGRISNPISGKTEAIGVIGSTFDPTIENMSRWKRWMKFVRVDQGIIFWLLGTTTLVLLALNASAVLGREGVIPEGTALAITQARIFSIQMGEMGKMIYLIMTYLMLFSVMWTVIDALTRIIADIVHTNSREGRLVPYFTWLKGISMHHLYYTVICIIVFIQAVLLPWNQPLTFLVISSVLGGFVMAIYTPFLIYLNNTKLPREIRPGWFTNIMMIGASAFYLYFAIVIALEKFS